MTPSAVTGHWKKLSPWGKKKTNKRTSSGLTAWRNSFGLTGPEKGFRDPRLPDHSLNSTYLQETQLEGRSLSGGNRVCLYSCCPPGVMSHIPGDTPGNQSSRIYLVFSEQEQMVAEAWSLNQQAQERVFSVKQVYLSLCPSHR